MGPSTPTTTLDVNGAIRTGSSTTVTTCGSGLANGEGSLRYNYTTHKTEFCNGSGWSSAISSDSGSDTVFSTPGAFSFTPTESGVYTVTLTGGGGGGGGSYFVGGPGLSGAGGGGGATSVYTLSLIANTTYSGTVGAGGAGGAGGTPGGGSVGTSSTITVQSTTYAGAGGDKGGVGNFPGAGGNAIGSGGVNGGNGTASSSPANPNPGGSGGSTAWGSGPTGTNNAGVTGSAYGTGGSGGGYNSATFAGGAGKSGYVKIQPPSTTLVPGTLIGSLSGNSTNVTGTVAIANGGTGQTTKAQHSMLCSP